jgi:hypothetical protein
VPAAQSPFAPLYPGEQYAERRHTTTLDGMAQRVAQGGATIVQVAHGELFRDWVWPETKKPALRGLPDIRGKVRPSE